MFKSLSNKDEMPVLCTAGSNYIIVREDGQIYKCFKDLDPIGTIDNYQLSKIANPCKVNYTCDSSSDQMFCTQWNYKPKKDHYINNPACTNWIDNNPNNLKLDHLYMIYYPTYRCNFECPYCCNYYPTDSNDPRPKYENEISTEKWIEFFGKINNKFSNVQININGGEPLLRSDISILLEEMLKLNFSGSMVTNLSVPKSLDKILQIENEKIKEFGFTITLHPSSKRFNFDQSLKYIKKFKDRKFKQRIVILAWPDHIEHYKQWKPIFQELNIPFWLKWCGGYDYKEDHIKYIIKEGAGKSTPQYLQDINWVRKEKMKFLKLNKEPTNEEKIKFSSDSKVYCDAGLSYMWIEPNGDILRCNTLNFKHKDKYEKLIIGNVITKEWNPLSDEELICNNHEDCFGCDACLSTQWIQENNKIELIERCPSHIPRNPSPFKANQDYVKYICVLSYKCNYDCLYCSTNELYDKKYEKMTYEHLINFFSERIKENPRCQVIMSPMGEPTRFPNFIDLVVALAKMKVDVHITTNLSQFKIIEEITSHKEYVDNIQFQISLHPFASAFNYDRFIGTASMIRKRGFNAFSLMVGNPVQIYLFDKYKKDLSKIGIDLFMQKDESKYGNRDDEVPESIRENKTREFEEKFINIEDSPKEEIIECTSGLDYFNINAKGEIHRCAWGYKGQDTFLGNSPKFIENYNEIIERFSKNPTCPKMTCYKQCEDFMLEVWKNKNKIWNSVTWRDKLNNIKDLSLENIWLTICLTEKCINACPYCVAALTEHFNSSSKEEENLGLIDSNHLCQLFEFLATKRKGIKSIEITGGGEPLLHSGFSKIINHATDLDYHVNITTSGLNNIERIYELRNFHKLSFVISFHPCSKNWNQDSVEKILTFIKSKKPDYITGSLVKYPGNLQRKKEIENICDKFNIKLMLYEQIK